MDAEFRLRAEALFQQAADLPASEREAFIASHCDSAALREEVAALLACLESADDGFLEQPAYAGADRPATPPIPERFGRYRVLRLVGEGGMGAVFEAEQSNPRRRVALKVIRRGMASAQSLLRFANEAQVLGQLQHPGIAQIYEAGTEQTDQGPQPFFAMEFIDGLPLIQFAEQHRLGTRARLELMAMICDAVEHAHTRGVVHRDLKPGNILVVGTGAWRAGSDVSRGAGIDAQPKILDFGVARATDADLQTVTLLTDIGQFVGTIPYMSPEQVSGDSTRLDARSDVYALGVVLYELLTGHLPLDVRHRSIPEAARMIREEEPQRLSSFNVVFRGDIETIVAKALDKDRDRRYRSAAELAADLRRYLRDQPIIARPASTWYQARKFARRNRAVVGGALATMLALALGVVASTSMAIREKRERQRADAEALAAERLAYRASIAAAQAALQTQNAARAARSLTDAPPELRGWEWRFIRRQVDRSIRTMDVGGGGAVRVSCAPDASRVIVGTANGALQVWDVNAGTRLRTQPLESAATRWAASRDADLIVLPIDGELVLQETATGIERWRIAAPFPGAVADFRPNGAEIVVAAAGSPELVFLDVASGRPSRRVDIGLASGLPIVSPDGRSLALVRGSEARVMDLATGDTLGMLESWAWSYTGSGRAVVTWDNQIQTWDARTIRPIRVSSILRGPYAVAMSPDDSLMACADATGFIHLILTEADIRVATIPCAGPIADLEFSTDGRRLISAGRDGTVRVWDANMRDEPARVPLLYGEEAYAAAISADGRWCATVGWGTVAVWDTASTAVEWRKSLSRRFLSAVAFSANGARLAVGGDRGELFVVSTADRARTMELSPGRDARVVQVAFTADGDGLLVALESGELLRMRLLDGSIQTRRSIPGALISALSPARSGGVVAVALRRQAKEPSGTGTGPEANESTIRLLDAETLEDHELPPWSPSSVNSATWLDSDRLVFDDGDHHQLRVWSPKTRRIVEMIGRTEAPAVALAASPDGARLVVGCVDGSVRLWELRAYAEVAALPGGVGPVRAMGFSADGERLISCHAHEPMVVFEASAADTDSRRSTIHAAWKVIATYNAALGIDIHRSASLDPFPEPIIARLMHGPSLPTTIRDVAVELLQRRGYHLNWLNSDAWGIVRAPGATPEQLARALARSEMVDQMFPDDPDYLNTLGTAQYRTGRFEQAIASLRRSEELYARLGRPRMAANWLVMAMAEHQLGRAADAATSLATGRALMAQPPASEDTENQAFLREAERLIESAKQHSAAPVSTP